MKYKISQTPEIQKLLKSEPFWMIYLACLEKSRNKWEISEVYGLMKEEKRTYSGRVKIYKVPKTNLYAAKLVKKMVDNGFLKVHMGVKSKVYLSQLSPMGFEKDLTTFLEQEWVRSSLLTIDNIKLFFKEDIDQLRRRGDEFLPLCVFLILFGRLFVDAKPITDPSISPERKKELEAYLKKHKKTQKEQMSGLTVASRMDADSLGNFMSLVGDYFCLAFPFDILGYLQYVVTHLSEHRDEIIELHKKLSGS